MAASTTSARERAWARGVEDPAGWALRNAHWLAGGLLLALGFVWLQTGVGPTNWSSDSRQNLYIANVLLLYMMVALGLNLISGYVGAASIGHIALFSIGAYTEAILTVDYGWHVWPAILAGAFAAMVASLPVGLILLRLSGWYFSVVTLLLVVVVADLILQQRDLTGGGAGIFGLTMPYIGSNQLDSREYIYVIAGINTIVFLMLRYLLDRTRWGRAFVAVREAEPAARAVGIHPFFVKESALAMSAFLAGLAGALFAPLPGLVNPESFPILDSIFFLLAILAGGMGTVAGPVVGTLTLYTVPELLNRQKALEDYSFMVYGVLLLLFVIFLPEGIVGGIQRLWYRLVGRRLSRQGDDALYPSSQEEAADLALAYFAKRKAHDEQLPALRIAGITKRFGDVAALSDVSVTIEHGTIHAVIGPNGSGKTTLLNIVSGFYRQERGHVTVRGRKMRRGAASTSIRHGVARTFQTPQVLRHRTAFDNVMLGCHARGRVTILEGLLPLPHVWRERKRFEQTTRACVTLVGLGPAAARTPVAQLPFPHQRLLEIARAVAGQPDILLLDEPASGLHPDEVQEFATLIRLLKARGLTIVLVEHNFALVGELADKITVLDAGSLLAEGSPEAVRSNPSVVEAYLGA